MQDPPPDATPSGRAADDPTDAALLSAVAAGGAGAETAFVALYRRRRDDIHRFAFTMARSRTFAQDVTQEVFLNVLENAARFDPAKGSVRAWLFGCARHVVLDRLRAERRWTDEVPELAQGCDGEQQVLTQQRRERLHAAIARLPIEYREALVLCELQELSYAESAAVLECPIGTVRSRLHRARALLTAALAESERAAPTAGAALSPTEVCS
jgi:RNA polymerase sigma-70 factor (ECF subfamily)